MGDRGERKLLGLKGNALTMAMTEFIGQGCINLTAPFSSLYILEFEESLAILGLISLISGLISIMLQAPVGYLSDKMGRKKLIVLGGFIASLAPFIYAFAPRWEWFIPGSILETFTQIMLPARQAMFADAIDPDERGLAFSTFHTLLGFPMTVMPVLSGFILEKMGLKRGMFWAFLISGFIMLAASLARVKYLKEKPLSREKRTMEFSAGRVMREIFEPVISLKALRIIVLGSCLTSISLSVIARFKVVYATGIIRLSLAEWGVVISATGVVGILTRIPMGKLTDRFGRKRGILISYMARPLFVLAFAYSRNLPEVLFINAGESTVSYLRMPAHEALITDIASAEMRGRAYGSFNMIPRFFTTIGPMIGSFLWETRGAIWCFYVSALSSICAAILIYLFLQEPEKPLKR